MEDQTRTYRIAEGMWGRFEERFEAMVKRAKKLGLSAPTYEKVGEEQEKVGMTLLDEPIYRRVFLITLSTPTIALPGGWRFAGTLQHMEAGNIVRLVPSLEGKVDTIPYRNNKPVCDHCKTRRPRKDTYLLMDAAGKVVQVGSSCLKDFLGQALVKGWMEYHIDASFGMGDEDWLGGGGWVAPAFAIEDYLAVVAICIRKLGWVSRKMAEQDYRGMPTSTVVGMLLTDKSHEAQQLREEVGKPTDADRKMATDALEWVRTSIPADTTSDYLYNLRIVASLKTISGRETGLVASIISAYQREIQSELERKQKLKSEWIGKVGDKIGRKLSKKDIKEGAESLPALTGIITMMRESSGLYGVTTIFKIITDEGQILSWFASGTFEGLAQGDKVTVEGTIKKHDEYKGIKETVLTRATLEKIQD